MQKRPKKEVLPSRDEAASAKGAFEIAGQERTQTKQYMCVYIYIYIYI